MLQGDTEKFKAHALIQLQMGKVKPRSGLEPIVSHRGELYEQYTLFDGRRFLLSVGSKPHVKTLGEVFADARKLFSQNHPILNAPA